MKPTATPAFPSSAECLGLLNLHSQDICKPIANRRAYYVHLHGGQLQIAKALARACAWTRTFIRLVQQTATCAELTQGLIASHTKPVACSESSVCTYECILPRHTSKLPRFVWVLVHTRIQMCCCYPHLHLLGCL